MRVLVVAIIATAIAVGSPSATADPPESAQPEASERVPASAEHVAAATAAQRSAYAITAATNGCPMADADLHGWPRERVRHCIYEKQDIGLGRPRVAVVYLLDVEPPIIARWIETACALIPTDAEQCFTRVLQHGRMNSGYMFPIAGNMLEDMQLAGHFRNYVFRNGMTTSFRRGLNGSADELSLEDQEALATLPNDDAIAIPSGLTRFWRTRPADFAVRFPDAGAPAGVANAETRAAWLDVVRREMISALESDQNRLLEAWLCANAEPLFAAPCAPSPPEAS